MKKAILALLPLLLAACDYKYVKPGASPNETNYDRNACLYDANKAVATLQAHDFLAAGLQRVDLIQQCMALKGYSRQ